MQTKTETHQTEVLRPLNVLIVDDDQDYLDSMKIQLEARGHHVVTACSDGEAAKRLEESPPDIALVDLMLETEDSGFTLCHHLKRRQPEMPIIMISGVQSETGFDFDAATVEERSWIKADAFLNKPVRLEQLEREMRRLLRRE
ncbi:MAG: response regulator [Planctomycetota bacterium]